MSSGSPTPANAGRSRDALIIEHLDVARRIALRVVRRVPEWLCADDLIAAGMIGLAQAADRYDATRGEPFIAFAEMRIRGAVFDELRRGDIMPRRVRSRARHIRQTISELEQALGRAPEEHEIARALDVGIDEYRSDLAMLTHVALVELETPETQPEAFRCGEEWSPAQRLERAERVDRVRRALADLCTRDAQVLALYYNEELTYAEIGDLLGISESRVCQLRARAIKRLKQSIDERLDDAQSREAA